MDFTMIPTIQDTAPGLRGTLCNLCPVSCHAAGQSCAVGNNSGECSPVTPRGQISRFSVGSAAMGCRARSSPVSSEARCECAAATLMAAFERVDDRALPGGCQQAADGAIRFNTHESGLARTEEATVCEDWPDTVAFPSHDGVFTWSCAENCSTSLVA